MPDKAISNLREYLAYELRRRNMTPDEFAKASGISVEWLRKQLRGAGPPYPNIETLLRLSEFTGDSVASLFHLVVPAEHQVKDISPDVLIYAQRIAQLPDNIKQVIETVLLLGEFRHNGNSLRDGDKRD